MPKASVTEFAKAVRQQYPGKFDDVGDEELVHAVVGEKPELGDAVDLRTYKPSATLRPPKNAVADFVGKYSGMGAYGRGFTKAAQESGTNIMKFAKGAATGDFGPFDDPNVQPEIEAGYERRGLGEQLGAVGENVAEFGGGEATAASATEGALKAAPRVLRAVGRIARGAAVGGTIAKVEGGSGTAGAIAGAAGPIAGEAADAAGPMLKEGAKKSMARVLGATTKPNKVRSAQVVPELIERGVTGSRGAIAERAAAGMEDANAALDEAWAGKAGEKLDVNDITKKMDDAAAKFQYEGPEKPVPVTIDSSKGPVQVGTEMKAPKGVVTPTANRFVKTLDQLKTVLTDNADAEGKIDAQKLRGVKKIWDGVVASKEGYAGANLSLGDQAGVLAHKEAANAIRGQLTEAYPDIAKINGEYTFWKRTHRVISDTLLRTSSQSQSMGEQIMKGAGVAAGFATNGISGAVVRGAEAKLFTKLVRSGKWGSVSAVTKDRLASAIASGNAGKIGDLIRRVAFGAGVQLTQEDEPNGDQ